MCQLWRMDTKHPLAVWREQHKLTQEDFARKVGTSRWTINSIETGRRKPSRDMIFNISKATDGAVGFDDLASAA
jgi:DNA-binding XRE family transcriptional regulator